MLWRRAATGSLCAVLCLGLVAWTPPALGQDVSVPAGAVAFFTTLVCPEGWITADYATGRLIVAVTAGGSLGGQVGTPLGDREDRTHQHDYATSLRLASKSIAGADSCCNGQGAWSKFDNPVEGTTELASSGLPFTQLVICEKTPG